MLVDILVFAPVVLSFALDRDCVKLALQPKIGSRQAASRIILLSKFDLENEAVAPNGIASLPRRPWLGSIDGGSSDFAMPCAAT